MEWTSCELLKSKFLPLSFPNLEKLFLQKQMTRILRIIMSHRLLSIPLWLAATLTQSLDKGHASCIAICRLFVGTFREIKILLRSEDIYSLVPPSGAIKKDTETAAHVNTPPSTSQWISADIHWDEQQNKDYKIISTHSVFNFCHLQGTYCTNWTL